MFTKPLEELSLKDIEELVNKTRFSESERIEYKENLPDNGRDSDPWHRGEDKIGDPALKKLTAEVVAFANTHGGTLILGIEESDDEPARPASIRTLPRCHELNHRLMQSISDSIEPRIDNLHSKVIECDDKQNGVIVISVPRSEYAPHRSTKDKEFYKRERHECKRMQAPDIKALALRSSRQKVEALWTLKYGTVENYINGGVVVFDEGKLYGGDSSYYYLGIYELTEDNRLNAYVDVHHYHGDPLTAFGTASDHLSLIISSNFIDDRISGVAYDPNTRQEIPFVMDKQRNLP